LNIFLSIDPQLWLGAFLIIALAVLAVGLRTIDAAGAIVGAIISLFTFLAGGFPWLVIIVIFFAGSSILTKFRYEYKKKIGSAQEKGGMRSWPNTIANGGVALLASVGEIYLHSDLFAIAYLTSIAAAMADTLGTEVGLLSHSKPRLITHLSMTVKAGTSGGITGLGESAAILSSVFVALVGIFLSLFSAGAREGSIVFLSVVIGAMIGTSADSFLGATAQVVNKCTVCGELTESAIHHDQKTVRIKGFRMIENNSVNLIGIAIGTVVAILIYLGLNAVL
jgi:uncharacterized protein (TIGR00297 family)